MVRAACRGMRTGSKKQVELEDLHRWSKALEA